MDVILDGKALADRILTDLAKMPFASSPNLLIISVGDDPESEVDIRTKVKAAKNAEGIMKGGESHEEV